MERLIEKLEEILEENVTPESVLEDFDGWDSMAIINMISFFDKEYYKTIRASDIRAVKTVKDLYNLKDAK